MDSIYTISFNVCGNERKRLARMAAEYMEAIPEYMGAPTFAYKVGGVTVDRDGTLVFGQEPDPEEKEGLLAYLAAKGFHPGGTQDAPSGESTGEPGTETPRDAPAQNAGENRQEENCRDAGEDRYGEAPDGAEAPEGKDTGAGESAVASIDGLTVSIPRDSFTEQALENLRKIVDSKRTLLKKALGAEELPIEVTEEAVSFPWFQAPAENGWEAASYTHLISAICEMARNAKRVTASEKEAESEKYSFRCFLLRLGFVGQEYKHERAFLMRNLSGHSAFRTKADAEAFNEKLKAKKAAEREARKQMEGGE